MEQKPIDLFGGFDFMEMPALKNSKQRLPEDICVVHYKDAYACVNFSALLNKQFNERGIKAMRVAYNSITEEVAFVFDNNLAAKGALRLISKDKTKETTTGCVSSRQLCMTLAEKFGFQLGDSRRLRLSKNLSKRPDVMFFTVHAE